MATARFVDTPAVAPDAMKGWDPIVVKKAQIDAEIEKLAGMPMPENGVRSVRIVHPQATGPGLGMSPGIDIKLYVLKPGERSRPMRQNSSQVSLCIRGEGRATIGGQSFSFGRHDVWNTPGMNVYAYRNDGPDLQVRLTYSNGALLEKMLVHYVEDVPESGATLAVVGAEKREKIKRMKELAEPIPVGRTGAQLLTYEHLISPEVVPNKPLLWAWNDIARERDRVFGDEHGLDNLGRRGLFVLYNPATGRTVGTTHSFFASVGFMPVNVIDFPHRHSSNAINYALEGSFVSEVNGERLHWAQGDIAYTAPGWSAHANGSETGGTALTIQDHPFQIATESLIWQEGEGKPIVLLGAEQGIESDNTVQLAKAS